MKFNSKILLLVLAAVVLTSLVACGGEKNDPHASIITTTKAPDITLAPITLASATTASGEENSPASTTTAPSQATTSPSTTTAAPVTTTKAPVTTTKAPVTTTKAPVTTTATPTTTLDPTPTYPYDPDDYEDDYDYEDDSATTTAPVSPELTPSEVFSEKKAEILAKAMWGDGGYGYDKVSTVTDSGKQLLSSLSDEFISKWSGLVYSANALDELQKAYNKYVVDVDTLISSNLNAAATFEKKKAEILASATWGEGGYRFDKASSINTDGRTLLGKLAKDFHDAWEGLEYSSNALSRLNSAYTKYKNDVNEIINKYSVSSDDDEWTKPIK